ncbi:MAG: sugar phosphate isomerase/epimerase family protein [Planctomycetota bacterium]
MSDLARLAVHTFTTKPWSLDECIEHYARAGIGGITLWCETYAGHDLARVRRHIDDAGLARVSVARGGFLTAADAGARAAAVAHNTRIIEECAQLGMPLLVLVCGATPGQTVQENLTQIQEAIVALLPVAEREGVRLGIEPLHPMYAADRSAVSSLACANDLAEAIASPWCGVVVDVYHLWWDSHLEQEIRRCGAAGHLFAYHICDWKPETEHMLFDRGLMGEGCIPLRQIAAWIAAAGFDGFHEVEIFSRRWWSENQHDYLQHIITAWRRHSAPGCDEDHA